MEEKTAKRKIKHVILVTSDAEDASVQKFHFTPWILELIIAVLCIVVGATVAYLLYEESIWNATLKKNNERLATIEELETKYAKLEQEKQDMEDDLNGQIDSLNEKILIMSNTLTQKVQSEAELKEEINKQSNPTELPINGPANYEELTEGTPMCIFTGNAGMNVVATASGTVSQVSTDPEFGNCVWIDHGNGYITIYRNKGDACVKQGETVVQGSTLFIMTKKNNRLGYQMMKDEEYINPMSNINING